MRDCSTPEMKDLLPDLLSDDSGHEAVRAHVAACESCALDLALLREVRAVLVTPPLDTDRIAAAIPAYRASMWRRAVGSPAMRIAAVVVLVLGGATLLRTAPSETVPDTVMTRVASMETARGVQVPLSGATAAANTRPGSAASELAVGDPLSDLSENDLRTLLQEMRDIKPVTSTETDVVVLPGVGQGGA